MRLVNRKNASGSHEGSETKSLQTLKELAAALSMAIESMGTSQLIDISGGIDFYDEIRRYEIHLIKRALAHTGGNQTQAAHLLGLNKTTLHGKIQQYNIYPSEVIY